MAPAIPKSREEVLDREYDWLACDSNGNVALFSTAGAGYAPAEFLRDTEAHDNAINALLDLPATTDVRFAPALAFGLINTWKLVAERGLYAYDCDPNGGPYRLVAAPRVATTVDALPASVADVVRGIRCACTFDGYDVVMAEVVGA